jgi:hypothetical protein
MHGRPGRRAHLSGRQALERAAHAPGEKYPRQRKIAHYEATLAMVQSEYPGLPLVDQLRKELAALRAELQRVVV